MKELSFMEAYRAELLGAFVAEGVDSETARRAIRRAETKIRKEWGGDRQYIPAADKETRDREILQALSEGADPKAVAKAQGVHPVTVRRVQKRAQAAGFGSPEWQL